MKLLLGLMLAGTTMLIDMPDASAGKVVGRCRKGNSGSYRLVDRDQMKSYKAAGYSCKLNGQR